MLHQLNFCMLCCCSWAQESWQEKLATWKGTEEQTPEHTCLLEEDEWLELLESLLSELWGMAHSSPCLWTLYRPTSFRTLGVLASGFDSFLSSASSIVVTFSASFLRTLPVFLSFQSLCLTRLLSAFLEVWVLWFLGSYVGLNWKSHGRKL